ncbi:CDP-alcohol phosphatidyltransferase family protein [soil metagenome]
MDSSDQTKPTEQLSSHKYLTAPNVFTLVRLCCIPIFLYMLFGRDNLAGSALLLGVLGATDWVDGWLARRFNQTSEFGKMFDPTADRLLFIVGITGILIKGIAPTWFFWAVIAREVIVGGTIAIATLAFRMKRFDVTWWGKTATFLLMFAIPGFMLGASNFAGHKLFLIASWIIGIPGLALSYYTGLAYVPTIRESVKAGRGGSANERG